MPAQLHGSHQRISSLAKEARDVQPGLIKDSTMMRPAISDRPLATEAHPNPSIPEEDGVRGKFRWFFSGTLKHVILFGTRIIIILELDARVEKGLH